MSIAVPSGTRTCDAGKNPRIPPTSTSRPPLTAAVTVPVRTSPLSRALTTRSHACCARWRRSSARGSGGRCTGRLGAAVPVRSRQRRRGFGYRGRSFGSSGDVRSFGRRFGNCGSAPGHFRRASMDAAQARIRRPERPPKAGARRLRCRVRTASAHRRGSTAAGHGGRCIGCAALGLRAGLLGACSARARLPRVQPAGACSRRKPRLRRTAACAAGAPDRPAPRRGHVQPARPNRRRGRGLRRPERWSSVRLRRTRSLWLLTRFAHRLEKTLFASEEAAGARRMPCIPLAAARESRC